MGLIKGSLLLLLLASPVYAVTVVIPAAGAADVNCPATIPSFPNASFTPSVNRIMGMPTCVTGAHAQGYEAESISAYIKTSTAGDLLSCAVYLAKTPPYTPPFTKVTGCDTIEVVLGNVDGWYTLPISSSLCLLSASTRYFLACDTGGSATTHYGAVAAANVSRYVVSTYANPLPSVWSSSSFETNSVAFYITATEAVAYTATFDGTSWSPASLTYPRGSLVRVLEYHGLSVPVFSVGVYGMYPEMRNLATPYLGTAKDSGHVCHNVSAVGGAWNCVSMTATP